MMWGLRYCEEIREKVRGLGGQGVGKGTQVSADVRLWQNLAWQFADLGTAD